jgi:hypothetical protein
MTSGTDPHERVTTGVPHAIASIIASPNGSGQSMVNNNARALSRNPFFSDSLISPIYSISGGHRRGFTHCLIVVAVDHVDLRRYFEWNSNATRHLDRNVRAFFRRYSTEKREIFVGSR